MDGAEVIPMVNQMEFHPYLVQQDLIDYCKSNQIVYEAWSPLMQGKILKDELIIRLAEKYSKTPGTDYYKMGFTERCSDNTQIR